MKASVSLADKLWSSEIVFKDRIDADRWILFTPDYPGLPVVVQDDTLNMLSTFDGGRTVFDVVSRTEDASKALAPIAFLQDNGLLRPEPNALPYTLPSFLEADPPQSAIVWLHVTNSCNLRCAYCFVGDKRPLIMSDEVATKTARALAWTASKYNIQNITIKLAGGEPTLAVRQLESFRSIFEKELAGTPTKLAFALLSNGTVLNARIVDFLKKPNTGITVSIDGYGAVHDTFRIFVGTGKGTWRVIQRNLAILRENGIRPFINATISSETCESLPELVRWIHDNGYRTRLDVVRQADCFTPWSRDTEHDHNEVCDRLIGSFERTFEELSDPRYSYQFISRLKICDLYFDNPAWGAPCGIGYNHIVVKPNGRVVSCPMCVDEEGIQPGNDMLEACRRSFKWNPFERQKTGQKDECMACAWYSVCAGGCPVLNLRTNNHPFSKSPFCKLHKFIIPRFISLLGRKMMHGKGAQADPVDAQAQAT